MCSFHLQLLFGLADLTQYLSCLLDVSLQCVDHIQAPSQLAVALPSQGLARDNEFGLALPDLGVWWRDFDVEKQRGTHEHIRCCSEFEHHDQVLRLEVVRQLQFDLQISRFKAL